MQQIKKFLRLAGQSQGLSRELLLIKAVNALFERHVVTEQQWREASPETRSGWQVLMDTLLTSLEYAVAAADAYSPELTGMAGRIRELAEKQESARKRMEDLTAEVTNRRENLAVQEADIRELENEAAFLQAIETLAPLRKKLRERLDVQAYRRLVNSELIPAMKQHSARLEVLQKQADDILAEQDRLLKQEIENREEEWAAVREAL